MSRFYKNSGRMIARIRRIRGITQKELADSVSMYLESPITEKTVSSWERGERTVSAEQLYFVANALHCSMAALCSDSTTPDQDQRRARFNEEIASFSPHAKAIFYHAMVEFDGDREALADFIGLYTSLSKEDRRHILTDGVLIYSDALTAGRLANDAPPIDIVRLNEQWRSLFKK